MSGHTSETGKKDKITCQGILQQLEIDKIKCQGILQWLETDKITCHSKHDTIPTCHSGLKNVNTISTSLLRVQWKLITNNVLGMSKVISEFHHESYSRALHFSHTGILAMHIAFVFTTH